MYVPKIETPAFDIARTIWKFQRPRSSIPQCYSTLVRSLNMGSASEMINVVWNYNATALPSQPRDGAQSPRRLKKTGLRSNRLPKSLLRRKSRKARSRSRRYRIRRTSSKKSRRTRSRRSRKTRDMSNAITHHHSRQRQGSNRYTHRAVRRSGRYRKSKVGSRVGSRRRSVKKSRRRSVRRNR